VAIAAAVIIIVYKIKSNKNAGRQTFQKNLKIEHPWRSQNG
jgi:hypothetical protein